MSISNLRVRYLGALLLLALVIGGSSQPGLLTNLILQLLTLPLLFMLAPSPKASPLGWPVWLVIGLSFALILFQVLPLGGLLGAPTTAGPAPIAISRDIGKTLEVGLFFALIVLFFAAACRCGADDLRRVVPYFLLGVIFNMVLALVQFASSAQLSAPLLPYPTRAGFFANPNHFASLVFVAIPFIVYQFQAIGRPLLLLPVLMLVVFVAFAAGSVAGSLLAFGCAVVSVALIVKMPLAPRLVLLALAIGGAMFLATNPGNVLEINPEASLDRTNIWKNTLVALQHYLPYGSGFGTFETTYQQFEPVSDVVASYANHAHNEYLELVLEGGIPAALLLAATALLLALAAWRVRNSALVVAATCGIVFLAIHSTVEYPLRNIGMELVFAYFSALLLVPPTLEPIQARRKIA